MGVHNFDLIGPYEYVLDSATCYQPGHLQRYKVSHTDKVRGRSNFYFTAYANKTATVWDFSDKSKYI